MAGRCDLRAFALNGFPLPHAGEPNPPLLLTFLATGYLQVGAGSTSLHLARPPRRGRLPVAVIGGSRSKRRLAKK